MAQIFVEWQLKPSTEASSSHKYYQILLSTDYHTELLLPQTESNKLREAQFLLPPLYHIYI